jgi:hypothetical protein
MMNTYTELLEQIVIEMKSSETNYYEWLDFLRRVYPESKLFKNDQRNEMRLTKNSRADPNNKIESADEQAYCSDLHEIISLAAVHDHPAWYIQPHFIGPMARFTYENEELKNALAINGVPKTIAGFNETVIGVWLDEQTFVATDIENQNSFLLKMERLKKAGFATPEFVLFPTEKLISVSVSKLEASLNNFISTAQKAWAKVDGVVFVSDLPLFGGGWDANSNRIIFKPNNQLSL